MGVVRRAARWTLGLGLAVLAITVATVLFFSNRNMQAYGEGRALEAPLDAIIVLGGGVDGDGTIGFSSRRRVRLAVSLLAEGKASRLILSGGSVSKHPSVNPASLMRKYAIGLGASPEALLVEDRSVSTFENLRFSFALAESRGHGRLAILTDAYHLERARLLAAYFGRPDIGLIAAAGLHREGVVNRGSSILREALAWWLNLAKVAGWEALGAAGLSPEARREWIR